MVLRPGERVAGLRGVDPNKSYGCHARAGGPGGVERPLVGEETVADHGDAGDHALCGVERVGERDPGHGERDEGFDPEVDYDVLFFFCWTWRGTGARAGGGGANAALHVAWSRAAACDEGSSRAG